ncbi:unnamed protein product [Linum trigynum]|uniref:Uncharacterized protein n=1 Tax=Linum trigynum TaxID=586398 RepID=A0AAV2DNU3_9ROSI
MVVASLRLVRLVALIIFVASVNLHTQAADETTRKIYNVDLDSSIIPNTKSAHLAVLKGVVQGVKPEDVLIETKLWFETFALLQQYSLKLRPKNWQG